MQQGETTQIDIMGPLTGKFQNPGLVQQNIKTFRQALAKILDPEVDIVKIQGKDFIRKSGWNVINQYWGVETKTSNSWRIELPDGEYAIVVVVEASQNGTHKVSRSAYCSTLEMKAKHNGKTYNRIDSDCHSMAESRAIGRVSAAWYMIGDVSAEEIDGGPMFNDNTVPQNAKRACKCDPATKNANPLKDGICPVCNGVRF